MKRISKYWIIGILLTLLLPIKVMGDIQPQWVIDMYEAHKYKTMAYRLLRPNNFDANKRYPVVITLHNGPGMADSTQINAYNIVNLRYMNRQFAEEPLRSDYPAYIFAPQADSPFVKVNWLFARRLLPRYLHWI